MISFGSLKLCKKYKHIDHIVNNIRLTQNLTYVLRASVAAGVKIMSFCNTKCLLYYFTTSHLSDIL